jgi:hypothetical protein
LTVSIDLLVFLMKNCYLANRAATVVVEVTVGRDRTGLPLRSTVRKVVVLMVSRGVTVVQLVEGLCGGSAASAELSTSRASVGLCVEVLVLCSSA